MKFHLLFSIFFLSGLLCKAQEFIVINDPDGSVNIRKENNTKSPIVWKANNGDILINYDTDSKLQNWFNVATASDIRDSLGRLVQAKNKNLQGFVYANRVILLNKLPHVKGRQLIRNKLTIKNDSLVFMVTLGTFKPTEHHIHKKGGFVDKIDGKEPYGIDGELPSTAITAIDLVINSAHINIPRSAFNDLYEPSLATWNVYFDRKGNIYITSQNSDGAGAYALVWVISDGKLVRRYIDNSNA